MIHGFKHTVLCNNVSRDFFQNLHGALTSLDFSFWKSVAFSLNENCFGVVKWGKNMYIYKKVLDWTDRTNQFAQCSVSVSGR